jgi:endogenous inhibitor of DNA gyrase (YacG/DUF329 family)
MADLGRWLSGDYRVPGRAPDWPEAPVEPPGPDTPDEDEAEEDD